MLAKFKMSLRKNSIDVIDEFRAISLKAGMEQINYRIAIAHRFSNAIAMVCRLD